MNIAEFGELSGKTVILSGATGMIGCCLVSVLTESGAKVVALGRDKERASRRLLKYWDRDGFSFYECDVNMGIPELGDADYIIHAASNTHPLQYSNDPIGTINSNIIGTKNLLDYGVSHGVRRFCFLSSVEIYGENRGDVERFGEDYLGYIDCNTLRAGYPESKRVGESLCNAYARSYGMDFVIPRLSRAYGPTMLESDSKAISQFIKKAVMGEDIVLKSAGGQLYSYVYAPDAAQGILTVLLKGESGGAYNISDMESEVTLREITKWLAEDNGVEVVYEVPEAGESKGYSTATKALLDTTKVNTLGWSAITHMREGLKITVDRLRQGGFIG